MLGPHVINRTSQARKWAQRCTIVKALDDPTIFNDAPDSALRVYRKFEESDLSNDPITLFNRIEAGLKGYRHANLIVEPLNELHPNAAQMTAIVREAHKRGYKVALAGWATGDYNVFDYSHTVISNPDYLSVHSYWDNSGPTVDNALSFMRFHHSADVPLLITECGRINGWNGVISAETMAKEFKMFAETCRKLGYVAGITPFTAGASDIWKRFDTDPLIDSGLI